MEMRVQSSNKQRTKEDMIENKSCGGKSRDTFDAASATKSCVFRKRSEDVQTAKTLQQHIPSTARIADVTDHWILILRRYK